jgi:hypothetical protein
MLMTIVLIAMWGLMEWTNHARTRGRVILDCGPRPMRWLFIVGSVFCGWVATTGSGTMGSVFPAAGYLVPALFAAFYLLMAFGRLQVVENGVWCYTGLMRWEKIASYHWSNDSTLSFRTTGPMKFLNRGAIPVPGEHRDAIDAAWRSHVFINKP